MIAILLQTEWLYDNTNRSLREEIIPIYKEYHKSNETKKAREFLDHIRNCTLYNTSTAKLAIEIIWEWELKYHLKSKKAAVDCITKQTEHDIELKYWICNLIESSESNMKQYLLNLKRICYAWCLKPKSFFSYLSNSFQKIFCCCCKQKQKKLENFTCWEIFWDQPFSVVKDIVIGITGIGIFYFDIYKDAIFYTIFRRVSLLLAVS